MEKRWWQFGSITSLICLMCCCFTGSTYAEIFTVADIQIEGLHRVDPGVVFNALPVRQGEIFDTSHSYELIEKLYNTGFFRDVKIYRHDHVLIIEVAERPVIGSVEITGNKEIKTEDLKKSLSSINIIEGRTYDAFILEQVKKELEQQYYSNGKYAARVEIKVNELPRNRVAIQVIISEGKAAKIRQILITGNHAFSNKILRKQFSLNTPWVLSWYLRDDQYAKEKLSGDLERLRSFYMDRGYVDFKINSVQVSLTPDKKSIYIAVNVYEGCPYHVEDVQISGQCLVPRAQITPLLKIKAGELYSRHRVLEIRSAIAAKFEDRGYSYTEVNPVTEIDRQCKKVKINFYINPGHRVYVRKISFVGNTKTQDQVLRRELTQMEGGFVSRTKIEQSKQRLARLGYVQDINVDTQPVPGVPDQVDLIYSVKEQPSGNFNLGLGYSQIDGLIFNVGASQNNFLGTGNQVGIRFSRSASETSYMANYFNPYYTVNGVGRGFTAFYNKTNLEKRSISNYTVDRFGGEVNYSIPLSLNDALTVGIQYQNLDLIAGEKSSVQVKKFVAENGSFFNLYSINPGWTHSSLDRALFPTKGFYNTLNGIWIMPGSNLQYFTLTEHFRYYLPIYQDRFVLLAQGEVDYGDGYGKTASLPFYANFYSGGLGSVRGFANYSLVADPATQLDSNGNPLGGNFNVYAGLELIFPNPFSSSGAWRTSVFFDAGNVYENDFVFNELRTSVGLAVTWLSPLGAPFVFSLAKPINKRNYDNIESFQFNIGSSY